MVTIKEVAEKAGVSPSTVSRVISDSPRISEETKAKVRKVMQELGYHPNAIARSLVCRTTNTIGIVMPRAAEDVFLNPFFPEALRGIAKSTHEEGYCILITTGNTDEEQLESLNAVVNGGRVDGIILMYSKIDDPILKAVKKMEIPFAMIGRPPKGENCDFVDNDNIDAAFNVTEHLIKMGHRRIGLINGSLNLVVSLDRFEGYKRALNKHNIELDESIIVSGEFVQEGGYEGMKKILQSPNPPTAIITTDDLMAFGAIKAAREMGVKIPKDVSIMSFNNIPLSEFATPALTSVEINAYTLGYEAAKIVIDKVKGRCKQKIKKVLKTQIIYRDSIAENINNK
ncbi:LacI family DNA-binding transcriptional regulator [Caloramator proteoclasticus]|uniref:Transcriptional regulator, LacI family n=1 Tax=Caloramator proteoclasticus DSM 10124 TaxID=1121262 RepID=A0A1M5AAJ3_9CLOT|nr:LacI family DNA-binding transcriptional regulator [Caloramator proteoclasticus]SHF27174.1 transcriptional regulator, LacI family [Caloramator proteoclasticus DSM 10124]